MGASSQERAPHGCFPKFYGLVFYSVVLTVGHYLRDPVTRIAHCLGRLEISNSLY